MIDESNGSCKYRNASRQVQRTFMVLVRDVLPNNKEIKKKQLTTNESKGHISS